LKIAVITPLFALSGVPLAQIRFARALGNAGHDVDLLLGQINPTLEFPALVNFRLINLNKPRVAALLVPIMKYLRTTQPEVVFSAEDHLNAVVLIALRLTNSRAKFSGSSRVTPFDTYSNRVLSKRWWLKQVMKRVMSRADVLTCVSQDMVGQYRAVFGAAPHVCIYNIVDDKDSRRQMSEPLTHAWLDADDRPVLVAAGQLAPWKAFTDLIKAMKLLVPNVSCKLIILGDGPQRAELEHLIGELRLGDHVHLEGYVSNPLKYFRRAKVFALTSLVEGLPNVLVEAMMCGCTPAATDCPTGPREVLQDGKYGYLAPVGDVTAIARAIGEALHHPVAASLLEQAVEPFSEHVVLEAHFRSLGIADYRGNGQSAQP
jgi:glycosyltransferase involved in cell wall biosynthesis